MRNLFKLNKPPVVMTKIIEGTKAIEAAAGLYARGRLFSPPIHLDEFRPATVRIAFYNQKDRLNIIQHDVETYFDTYLRDDDAEIYGYERTTIVN